MCMKTKDEKSDILEGPRMLMKIHNLKNFHVDKLGVDGR